jgi:hypothetical protein
VRRGNLSWLIVGLFYFFKERANCWFFFCLGSLSEFAVLGVSAFVCFSLLWH